MRPEEARGLGHLAADAAAGVAAQARDVHAGIAGRVFGLLGAPAAPVRAAHDQISAAAYAGACRLTGSLVRGGGFAFGLTRPDDAPSLASRPGGRAVLGAINGAWGTGCRPSAAPCRRR